MRKKNDGKGRMGGRKAGTPNKVTGTVKEWIAAVIDGNRKQFESDMKKLEPKDRVNALMKLLEYVVPKQASVRQRIDFSSMSENELDVIVDRLIGGNNDEDSD